MRPGIALIRPRHLSLRARLTLTYGGLFLVAGLVLLGVTYALFDQQLARGGPQVLTKTGVIRDGSPEEVTEQSAREQAKAMGDLDAWARRQRADMHEAATASLVTQGSIALLVAGGVAAGLGWLIGGRVLAPLDRVTETARRIAGAPAADRGLHERIALHGPDDEVKRLADTFDTMLERLDRSFDGQRRFVANASHELRTPLTLGRALVEVAMHRADASPDVLRLGETLLEINLRHERLITGLLLLARSESEITDRAPVDLADVVGHVAAQTVAEADAAGVTVRTEAAEAVTAGDALLLERVVQNLVENGIRHNSGPGGWVRVACRADGANAVLEVGNSGPAVPPHQVPALFEPFRRLGSDRVITSGGAGLGLSIVRSIARAHGGTVTALPRTGGGLQVTVTLPSSQVTALV
ncbi:MULTISPECIES: cell wall metabolism sensor histidine kinase WalK [Actinomadura]|uniref:histidine kinase n=1 Tax=Actinomadura litoris TaxID=2678616 RepID=A0A7K1KYS4_9ACTN|nr:MULTISPECIES: HAMP domain-containing sensor histidine kinase [Actinomadura]MBT2209068.1 HAMP domain-containing histidine kinase [Actinomadura sp. NEAU-AAG7]MUN37115.1 HAMP domain-containing protein [Actinomadura litoris]